MQAVRNVGRAILPLNALFTNFVPVAGLKSLRAPTIPIAVEMPSKPKLRVLPKSPVQDYPPGTRLFKMQKNLKLMRGPEQVHNSLIYKQFGIVALGGGRLRWEHFEMIRNTFSRKIKFWNNFAIWRVDPPWQPITKKTQGMRMGGGKGAINHYATPVKAGRVIVEIAGKCEYYEVKKTLEDVANRLPFKAMAVSQEILDKQAEDEKWRKENNCNPWDWKYIIQNNMLGYNKYASRYERKWFNKYI